MMPTEVQCKTKRTGEQLYRKESRECYREQRKTNRREKYASEREENYDEWFTPNSSDRLGAFRFDESYDGILDSDIERTNKRFGFFNGKMI